MKTYDEKIKILNSHLDILYMALDEISKAEKDILNYSRDDFVRIANEALDQYAESDEYFCL